MTTSDVTLVAASDDPGPGTDFHESSGRIWAFCKRNAISKNAIIRNIYHNTKNKRIEKPDEIISQH